MRYLFIALFALATTTSNAWAWGDTGHRVVCELAFRLSAPKRGRKSAVSYRRILSSISFATPAFGQIIHANELQSISSISLERPLALG